ncbi:MAG TPA: magnesium/cobalt transporter CorA [Candidatus Limnocylindria bacterium]|jgi:magnesium transporter
MAPSGRTCILRHHDGRLEEVDLSHAAIARLDSSEQLAWLDYTDPDADDLADLAKRVDLHELALEDLRKRRQRTKLDSYRGQKVIVAYEVTDGADARPDFTLGEMHLIAGNDYLVTVHWGPSPAIDEVRDRWRQQPDAVATSQGGLLYALLDTVADGYFPLLDRLSERIDELQDRIVSGERDANESALRNVLDVKRELLELRRVVAPLRDVANALLRRDVAAIDDALVPYYQDLYDHLVRVLDTIDLYREMLAAALDANLSMTSNNLNVVVKRLTAFTVILMVPTLIAGIYGMNFDVMPELEWPFGYAFALALMACSMLAAYLFFRARDWF